jgi:hypothetical protein
MIRHRSGVGLVITFRTPGGIIGELLEGGFTNLVLVVKRFTKRVPPAEFKPTRPGASRPPGVRFGGQSFPLLLSATV